MSITVLNVLEEYFANNGRRVVSDWRAALVIWRATEKTHPSERRWQEAPNSAQETRPILDRLAKREHLKVLNKSAHLYQVASPFANVAPINEFEVLLEANPFCAISHHSAMVFHQLTLDFPNDIHACIPRDSSGLIPLETLPSDWDVFDLPPGRRIKDACGIPVQWHSVKSFAGVREARHSGFTIRVTNLERTLLDGLQEPDWCGGFQNVLGAWRTAKDQINIGTLIKVVDEMDINLLRQRAGFVLERLGLDHPRLKEWKTMAKRGGSSRLVAKEPFSSTYDQAWSLSINAPIEALDGSQP